jgi:glycosyltransferase 2 family protein
LKHYAVWKYMRPVLQTVFLIAIFSFLLRFIVQDWDTIREAITTASVKPMIAAAVCFFLGTLNIGICWRAVLVLLGARISYLSAFKSFYWSVLCKYMPGKIWGATVRIIVAGREGVPEGSAALGVLLETILLIVSAGAVGGIAMTQWQGNLPWWVHGIPPLSMGLIILLHPKILTRLIRLLSRKYPSWVVMPDTVPNMKALLLLTWMYSGIWVFWGAGLYFCIDAFHPLTPDAFVAVVGGNTFAWLAGFVAVMFPAGVGVRELVLTYLVSGETGTGTAALAAVLARIFVLAGEVIGALIAGGVRKSSNLLDRTARKC